MAPTAPVNRGRSSAALFRKYPMLIRYAARDLFARVQRRSLRDHNRMPIGETMARVGGDSWCVHTVVDELCFTPLHVVVTVAGVIAAMASINLKLTLLAIAVVPGMALASLL